MSRLIYRVCLLAILLIAVAGGVYYYTAVYQKEAGPQKGPFVDRTGAEEPNPEYKYADWIPASHIPAWAVETGKEADANGSTGYALFEN